MPPLIPLFLLLLHHGLCATRRSCVRDDTCGECELTAQLAAPCTQLDFFKFPFLYCNPRTKKIASEPHSYLVCENATQRWTQEKCGFHGDVQLMFIENACVDPSRLIFHAQATSVNLSKDSVVGSGRVGDQCSFNTDCLGGMYCALGMCRCLSTYIAVDSYCYEKISPSQSGCFYDTQCSAVWPDAYCKSGMCHCPSDEMTAVKTRDGVVCVWVSASEPTCPLPNLPPPDSPSSLVVLPAPSATNSLTIAACNPHSSSAPSNDEELLKQSKDFKCAVRGLDPTNGSPKDVSDIYDCIDNSPFWRGQGIDTAQHPVGVCCMNKAFACMQPRKGESEAIGSIPRWWFNSVVGSCQQFLFDPTSAEVSPNNFETLDHCEAYCKDACPRGNPAYSPSRNPSDQYSISGCSAAAPCPEPFECTDVASQQLCCPSRKSVCSDGGGREKDPTRSTPFDPGFRFDQITGEAADIALGISTRYFYSQHDGQCHPFTYAGYLGNFNNFVQLSDCQMFCARLQCVHGNPLTSGLGVPQRCSRDGDCPSTHSCSPEHSVCCPTAQTLCTEPLRVGDCKQSVRQYWYNAETRSCQAFLYTGCQGNNNRFNSLNDCQSFCKNINAEPKCPQGRAYMDVGGKFYQCGEGLAASTCPANYECHFDGLVHGCCPSKAYTCSLQMNKGVACGSGSSYRYYYNSQLKECQSFMYLGCDGNSNNFPSAEKCQAYCEIGGCPNGGNPLRVNNQIRTCSSNDPCPGGYECSLVNVNGRTQRRCCPTKASICTKPPQMGLQPKCSSGGNQVRFYFNVALKACSQYTSNGCDTSLNSFSSIGECEEFCLGAGCKNGDTVYKDPNTNRAYTCNTALQNSCPTNYECVLNSITGDHLCCVCPAGEKAFIDSKSTTPRECLMNAEGRCPPGYLCRFSMNHNRYYCCGSANGMMCPSGRALFRYSTTQSPIQCSISVFASQCPPGYSCVSDVPGAFQGFCCSASPICPGGAAFHVDEKSQMPSTCKRDAFSFCPQGFTCQQQPDTQHYHCCAGQDEEAVQDGCPPGEYVYLRDGDVFECDPFNTQNAPCPVDYSCQWAVQNQRYQCCGAVPIKNSKPSPADDGCSHRHSALMDPLTKSPKLCTAAEPKSCPVGYFCQFSSKNGVFQCCGQGGGCPKKRVAFIAVDGNPQECLPGPETCADGFECTKLRNGKHICCTKAAEVDCLPGETAVNGECVHVVPPKSPCTKNEQCGGGSTCIDNMCRCPPEKTLEEGECRDRECAANEVRVHGVCVQKVDIGQTCKASKQCRGHSKCVNGVCDCAPGERIEDGKCVKYVEKGSEEEEVEKTVETRMCPREGDEAFTEEGSQRIRFCSRKGRESCPDGFSCQLSPLMKQNICCGDGIPKSRPVTTSKPTSPVTSNLSSVCPLGMIPYLLNGAAKSCTSSSCPYGYSCKYSPSRKDYFCCTKQGEKKKSASRLGDGCLRGSVLVFPQTREPVRCEPLRRPCPSGFNCLRHTSTREFQCCSVDHNPSSQATEEKSECPPHLFEVRKVIDGREYIYCDRVCPYDQVAVRGKCVYTAG